MLTLWQVAFWTEPMSVVAYVRVSTKSQDGKTQRAAIERAARARGDKIAQWYFEKKGGETLDRAQLSQLRADAREAKFSKLYVYRLDRLSRGDIVDQIKIVNELVARHIRIVNVADPFGLDGPESEFLVAIFAWLGKKERQRIGENIAAARQRIEAAGGRWGRPARASREEQRKIHAFKKDGFTVREIAVKVKIPYGTVSKVLCRKGAYAEPSRARTKTGQKTS